MQSSQLALEALSPKNSQRSCKTICEWFSECWVHKAVHQANRPMEKDFRVNEVWSAATEDSVCHQIYTTVVLWFPAAVKQWGSDWSKLHSSCQHPHHLLVSHSGFFKYFFLWQIASAFYPWLTHVQASFLLTSYAYFISLWHSLCHFFQMSRDSTRAWPRHTD